MKLIIGLVGEKGAGKGTFAKFLQDITPNSVSYYHYSDILVETLNVWSLPLIRSNYQNLANTMEKTFGSGTLAKAIKKRINNLPGDVIIVDGIRRWPEAALIRSFPNNLIIYITADVKTRFRNLKRKSDKLKETNLTWEQFVKEESNDAEILIPEIGKSADFKIVNEGSHKDFEQKVRDLYKNVVLRLATLAQ